MTKLIGYDSQKAQAVFAGGCFWGIQYYFDEIPGVTKTIVGYTGGKTANPSYDDMHVEDTGHAEAVLIDFDPKVIDYRTLLKHFFRIHDPTMFNRQGPNVGSMYRSAIFYLNDEQKKIAEEVISEIAKDYDKPIATQVTKGGPFYEAEDYHQKFTQKYGIGFCGVDYKPL